MESRRGSHEPRGGGWGNSWLLFPGARNHPKMSPSSYSAESWVVQVTPVSIPAFLMTSALPALPQLTSLTSSSRERPGGRRAHHSDLHLPSRSSLWPLATSLKHSGLCRSKDSSQTWLPHSWNGLVTGSDMK